MRSVLIAITALFIGWNSHAIFTEPEDYRPVVVTVREGDTLEQIAYRLKEKYNIMTIVTGDILYFRLR